MLKITKIFNNNAIQAENELGTELVVLGKGIAFGKKVGELAQESVVEKTFSLAAHPFAIRLAEIWGEIPQAYFHLTNRIVEHANQALHTSLSPSIYAALTDHLYHAVLRAKQQQRVNGGLSFDIQRLYKQEFAIGKWAVALIEQEMQVTMGDDEASFIALHIFNARTDSENLANVYKATQIIKDILNLVKYHFHLVFDEESLDYARFLTHLQHFALRLLQSQATTTLGDDFLYQQTKMAYPQAYACVEKIDHYLQQTMNKNLNNDEQLYLIIHIQRLIATCDGKSHA